MKLWIRRLAILIILLAVALAAAVYLLSNSLLGNYRPEIERALSSAIGAKVEYGEVRIFLPLSELILIDLSIESLPGNSIGVQGKVPRVSLRIDPISLLNHRLDIHAIVIEEPQVSIQIAKEQAATVSAASRPGDSPVISSTPILLPDFIRDGLEIHAIEIQNGLAALEIARSGTTSLDLKLNNITLDTDIAWTTGLINLNDTKLSLTGTVAGLPARQISLHTKELSYTPPSGQIAINSGEVTIDGQSLSVAGNTNSTLSEFALRIHTSNLDLARLTQMAAPFGVMSKLAPIGKLTASINLGSTANTKTVTGDLRLQDFVLDSSGVRIAGVTLAKINLTSGPKGSILLATTVDITGVRIRSDDTEYQTASARGPINLNYAGTGAMNITSDLAVRGFVYKDPLTTLEKVDAELSQIKCVIAKDQSTDLRLNLRGTSVVLHSNGVSVKQVTEVTSPLVVLVSARGGYRVSGPVRVSNSEVTVDGHELKKVSGTVDILVSDSVKRFITKDLAATQGAETISTAANFEMTTPFYKLNSLNAQLAGGSLTGSFTMARGDAKQISTKITAQNIDLGQILTIANPKDPAATVDGTIQNLQLSVKGNKDAIPASLSGKLSVQLVNGIVNKLNVDGRLKEMLGSVPVIGGMFQFEPLPKAAVTAGSNDNRKYAVKKLSTRALTATFKIGDGRMTTSDLLLRGKHGNVTVTGSYFFDDRLDLQGTVVFLEQTARALAGPITPLAGLFGSLGRIEIPLKITGPIADPTVGVDATRLMQVSAPGRIVGSAVTGVGDVISGIGGIFGLGGGAASSSGEVSD